MKTIATILFSALLCSSAAYAADAPATAPTAAPSVVQQTKEEATYVCPMHPEQHSKTPAKCPVCGMTMDKMESSKEHTHD